MVANCAVLTEGFDEPPWIRDHGPPSQSARSTPSAPTSLSGQDRLSGARCRGGEHPAHAAHRCHPSSSADRLWSCWRGYEEAALTRCAVPPWILSSTLGCPMGRRSLSAVRRSLSSRVTRCRCPMRRGSRSNYRRAHLGGAPGGRAARRDTPPRRTDGPLRKLGTATPSGAPKAMRRAAGRGTRGLGLTSRLSTARAREAW